MWSRKFDRCIECKRDEIPHMAKGLCGRCYMQQYVADNRETVAKYKRDWYFAHHEEQLAARKITREQIHFSGMREAAIRVAYRKCQRCGSDQQLCVHHKDRNGRGCDQPDNTLDNLEVLCRRCHINEHRAELVASRRQSDTPKLNKHGTWSIKHDACTECASNCYAHAAKGLCTRCYQRAKTR